MDSRDQASRVDVYTFMARRKYTLCAGTSRLAALHEYRRDVKQTLFDLNAVPLSESPDIFIHGSFVTSGLAHQVALADGAFLGTFSLTSRSRAEFRYGNHDGEGSVLAGSSESVHYFDFDSNFDLDREVERLRKQYPPLIAARLANLIRRELVRRHFERVLRFVNKAITIAIRLVRTPEFISSLFVRQSAWFTIHGEHPPRKSARVAFAPIFAREAMLFS